MRPAALAGLSRANLAATKEVKSPLQFRLGRPCAVGLQPTDAIRGYPRLGAVETKTWIRGSSPRKTTLPALARAIGALFMLPASALAQSEPVALPEVNVIAPSPLGGYVDRDKVPGTVQTLTAPDFTRTESPNVTDTLFQRIPGVSVSDPSGNAAAQELNYRGFAASPVQGTPQGIAVNMSGIRFNEAFGDTVNWDLIPTIAIDSADLWTNNPVFGLNALGGAINFRMKNGFTYRGTETEFQGGSFVTFTGAAQTGLQFGDDAVYLAAQGLHQGGWRFQSSADYARVFADFGRQIDRGEFHLVAAGASS